ncbi:Rnf-Nqr domain containing protein [Pseudomonas sp.]|uniref:Rnf-Nqr domain containing protein n=1 Tax=Pseudomonas sp. TaxID=306 RepID=UPI0026336C0E|nr:Rnf-Nqr domain containing protein [Pseudomonas sp.]
MTDFILTLISAALINNLVVQWPLSVDPLLKAPRQPEITRLQVHALGIATAWVMLCSSLLNLLLYRYLLMPRELGYLQLLVFLPVSVLLISPCLSILSRLLPGLPLQGLWPLLLANAGILGLTLLSTQADKGLFSSVALILGAGLGFWLVLSLFHDLRQRIQIQYVPLPFRGLPIELICAGLMGLAFLGFSGLVKP